MANALEVPTDEEAAQAELYIPGLTNLALFHALPAVDELEKLLGRHVPPHIRPRRDLSGQSHGRTVPDMIASQSWRALAVWAADTVIRTEPTRTVVLLELWQLRLQALFSLRLLPTYHRELSTLFYIISQTLPFPSILSIPLPHHPSSLPPMPTPSIPNAADDPDHDPASSSLTIRPGHLGKVPESSAGGSDYVTMHPAVPFGLLVMRARAIGTGTEGKPIRYEMRLREIDAVRDLVEASRRMAVKEARLQRPNRAALWQDRTHRMSLVLASILAGLGLPATSDPSSIPTDPLAAHRLFDALVDGQQGTALEAGLLAKVKMTSHFGDLVGLASALESLSSLPEASPSALREAKILRAAAAGKWEEVAKRAEDVEKDAEVDEREKAVVGNNKAVALLYAGKLDEALSTMSAVLIGSSDSGSGETSTTEPILFNHATLVELRSDRALEAKRDTLVSAAGVGTRGGGRGTEGLRSGCFKLE